MKNKEKHLKRLEVLKNVNDNWDGENAKKANEETLKSALLFIEKSHLSDYSIYITYEGNVEFAFFEKPIPEDLTIEVSNNTYKVLLDEKEYPNVNLQELCDFLNTYKEENIML